ncbi:MAG: phosphatidylglycerophosphatase A [Burkholderiales bacterium]|nr:phosphatidylglycerophosphatase A [Burkholderiales bacterium]
MTELEPGRAPPVRPTLRFMLSHPAHVISLGLGSGLAPVAPGTFGTLLGWLATRYLHPMLGDVAMFALLGVALLLGTWAVGVTGRALGESDHGAIVWDEVVAIAIITAMLPGATTKQVWAFLLFRLLDIAKPGPVGWADRRVKGAVGVMLDDLVAAALTLLAVAFWIRLL